MALQQTNSQKKQVLDLKQLCKQDVVYPAQKTWTLRNRSGGGYRHRRRHLQDDLVRIELDTNVIVAAFAGRGLCAEVFVVCITGHTLVASEYILAEVGSALLKKVNLPTQIIRDVIDYLRDTAEIVEPDPINNSMCRAKDDFPIIGTATKGNASFIVTGDADLSSLKNYRGIDIITPREFWDRLR